MCLSIVTPSTSITKFTGRLLGVIKGDLPTRLPPGVGYLPPLKFCFFLLCIYMYWQWFCLSSQITVVPNMGVLGGAFTLWSFEILTLSLPSLYWGCRCLALKGTLMMG